MSTVDNLIQGRDKSCALFSGKIKGVKKFRVGEENTIRIFEELIVQIDIQFNWVDMDRNFHDLLHAIIDLQSRHHINSKHQYFFRELSLELARLSGISMNEDFLQEWLNPSTSAILLDYTLKRLKFTRRSVGNKNEKSVEFPFTMNGARGDSTCSETFSLEWTLGANGTLT